MAYTYPNKSATFIVIGVTNSDETHLKKHLSLSIILNILEQNIVEDSVVQKVYQKNYETVCWC
jgi:hypothetical protein